MHRIILRHFRQIKIRLNNLKSKKSTLRRYTILGFGTKSNFKQFKHTFYSIGSKTA
jgi:hypothetical protein